MIRPISVLLLSLLTLVVVGRPDPGPWWSSAVPLSSSFQEPRDGRSNGQQSHSNSRQGNHRQSVSPLSSYGAPRAPPIAAPPRYGNSNANAGRGRGRGNPNNVLEIAIRKVKSDQATFEQARANFVNLLKQEQGVITDAEFRAVLTADESFNLLPAQGVFVGMTQYEDLETFQRIQQKLGNSPELQAFFQTFDVQCFHIVKGFDGTLIDLDGFPFNPQLIELAVRDVKDGQLQTFDQTRRKFISFLSSFDGVGQSGEYQDTQDPTIRVGTTFYKDEAALRNFGSQQGSDPNTFEYFSTFDVNCYYILERIN